MKIEIITTEMGIEYRCDEPFIRGLANTLGEALEQLKQIKELMVVESPNGYELSHSRKNRGGDK